MLGLVQRLKKNECILESKMLELNQNKKVKTPGLLGDVWKLYFILEIKNKHKLLMKN